MQQLKKHFRSREITINNTRTSTTKSHTFMMTFIKASGNIVRRNKKWQNFWNNEWFHFDGCPYQFEPEFTEEELK